MNNERFVPRPLPRRLRLCRPWVARLSGQALQLDDAGVATKWPVLNTTAVVHRGWLWSRVSLAGQDHSCELAGLSHSDAERLAQALQQAGDAIRARLAREQAEAKAQAQAQLVLQLQADQTKLESLQAAVEAEWSVPRYLAARDGVRLQAIVAPHADQIAATLARLQLPGATEWPRAASLRDLAQALNAVLTQGEQLRQQRNERFVARELKAWRPFFDHCEARPLTDEQAIAAITFEENTLLVAAAGSGKTSTVVGKVAYALAKDLVHPEEVLCLAFNSKAAGEIGERIKTRLRAMTSADCPIDPAIKGKFAELLARGAKIEARTFHSLGREIVEQAEGRKRSVSNPGASNRRLEQAIENCKKDPSFLANWLMLQTAYRFPQPKDSRFSTEEEYDEYLRGIWRQRAQKEGILSLGSSMPVRSFEEVAISNWLYVMGVEFEYELPFEEGAALLCPGKTWTPDFTYRVRAGTGEQVVVHEHFGLNARGEAPSFMKDPRTYAKQAMEKQAVLRKLGARHFWTTSAEYADGTLFTKLANRLHAAGVVLRPRSSDAVLERLQHIGQKPDNDLVKRAVSQVRQNGWDRKLLEQRLTGQQEPQRLRLFLEVVFPVAREVERLLNCAQQIDYDAMIALALDHLERDPALLPFRFILVDEFQDTAPGRGTLVQRMVSAKPDAYFFAVGDDWQAINRFAGSDLRFFREFGRNFNRRPGADRRCDLTQTFRSNQGIADIAKAFVLKNKTQLPKRVDASDKTREGVVEVRTYRTSELRRSIDATLQRWVAEHPAGSKPSVFVLGRYGSSRLAGLAEKDIDDLSQRWASRVTFKAEKDDEPSLYTTMHRSKGLEADYVLILGLHRVQHDYFCFPSEQEDDPLLQLVLPPKEALNDADERRLFYVALTRAKRQVVLLVPERHASPYVLELLRDHQAGEVLFNGEPARSPVCTQCQSELVLCRPNKDRTTFFACANWNGCGKTWSTWPPATSSRSLGGRVRQHRTPQKREVW